LQEDVLHMRAKIAQHQEKELIKQYSSPLLDLEFLIHYLVLYVGEADLARCTHPLNQLKKLVHLKILSPEEYQLLNKAYQYYHALLHQHIICSEQPSKEDDLFLGRIATLCQQLYKKY
jgi:[glutamine synthetase] adenylyltransferase / [glutamine synthetase]-adenylyl-L-tyrosine phosphorylase